jgi:hypothetical protein
MSSVVIEKVLEAIHYVLEHNEFKFTDKQLSLADDFITPFIDDLDIDSKEFNVVTVGVPKLVNDKRIFPILTKYFAFIEDNMALYTELKQEDYSFIGSQGIKFYALDRVITGNFKKNEYKNILLKYENAISKFYSSIRGLDKESKEKYSKEFSDIVHIDQTTLKVGYDDENINCNYLILNNIKLFGKDFLLKLNSKQREMINNMHIYISEEEALKIKELFTKYPEYSSNIEFGSDLLKYCSVDEISSMSVKDSILYEEAIKAELFDRMRNILKLNPEFNCPSSFIRKEIFDVLSDEEIVGLTYEGIEEILDIKIPEIDNVIVKPVKKIRKVLAHDEKRKNNTGGIKK